MHEKRKLKFMKKKFKKIKCTEAANSLYDEIAATATLLVL